MQVVPGGKLPTASSTKDLDFDKGPSLHPGRDQRSFLIFALPSDSLMIRVEVKVVIPDDKTREDFLKYLLDNASEDAHDMNSFFWLAYFDIAEVQRASLEAVLGQAGFPFLDGTKLLVLTCDFASEKMAQRSCDFFQNLGVAWDIEINKIYGTRVYKDIVEFDELE